MVLSVLSEKTTNRSHLTTLSHKGLLGASSPHGAQTSWPFGTAGCSCLWEVQELLWVQVSSFVSLRLHGPPRTLLNAMKQACNTNHGTSQSLRGKVLLVGGPDVGPYIGTLWAL